MGNLYLCETVNISLAEFYETLKELRKNEMVVILTVSFDNKYIGFIYYGEWLDLLSILDETKYKQIDIQNIQKEEELMVSEQITDSNGNVVYESHDDGYVEINKYDGDKLIRSEQHYSNGLVEVEHFSPKKAVG